MRVLILILLFASPVFAQCGDSVVHAKDSTIAVLKETVVEQAKQNISLFEQRVASDRRCEDMIRAHDVQDSIRKEQLADERWYSHSLERERPLLITGATLLGVALCATFSILIHSH